MENENERLKQNRQIINLDLCEAIPEEPDEQEDVNRESSAEFINNLMGDINLKSSRTQN